MLPFFVSSLRFTNTQIRNCKHGRRVSCALHLYPIAVFVMQITDVQCTRWWQHIWIRWILSYKNTKYRLVGMASMLAVVLSILQRIPHRRHWALYDTVCRSRNERCMKQRFCRDHIFIELCIVHKLLQQCWLLGRSRDHRLTTVLQQQQPRWPQWRNGFSSSGLPLCSLFLLQSPGESGARCPKDKQRCLCHCV